MSDRILLAHGSGGRLSHELLERLFLRYFHNPLLAQLGDAAVLEVSGLPFPVAGLPGLQPGASNLKLAFTTDSYVVSPLFFPGGDIGKLAVCGTVNDLSMSGAVPLCLSAGFILEEGLPLADLERVVASMAETARSVGVPIVTGDTKVVERGKADRLFINTAGIGVVPAGVEIGAERVRPGDVVILSGTIGDHGMTIMSQREGLRFDSPLVSDCAPLHGLVGAMFDVLGLGGQSQTPLRQAQGRLHCAEGLPETEAPAEAPAPGGGKVTAAPGAGAWASGHRPPTGVGGLPAPEPSAPEAPAAGGGRVTAAPGAGAWASGHRPPTGVGGLPETEAPAEAPAPGGGGVTATPGGLLHCLRDPTRGGLATVLNEVASQAGVGIEIEERAIPVQEAVRAACELLGLDPLYVANEGKLVAFVAPAVAGAVLARMRTHEYGREAAVIGQVTAEHPGRVVLRTPLGARRVVDMLAGEQLPRIC